MMRQACDAVDLKFCLAWHMHSFNNNGDLYVQVAAAASGGPTCSRSECAVTALVLLTFLETLDLISSDDAGATYFGDALLEVPSAYFEQCLIASFMMQFGILHLEVGENLEMGILQLGIPQHFSWDLGNLPACANMFCLAMCLVPMQVESGICASTNSSMNLGICAFESLLSIALRTLRDVMDASLASVVLRDPSILSCLSGNIPRSKALLPAIVTDSSSHRCMGLAARFFLKFEGDSEGFRFCLASEFPWCIQPMEDFCRGLGFWRCFKGFIEKMSEQDVIFKDFFCEMQKADELVSRQQRLIFG